MPKLITTEEFVEKAIAIHGDKYDYSKVEYEKNDKPVCIICPIHGEFWQRPEVHVVKKCGCPECAGTKKKTTKEFILEAKAVHGAKYDYSKVEYKRCDKKVAIICPEHGEFWQTPLKHVVQKCGCPECGRLKQARSKTISHEKWVETLKKRHPDIEILGRIVDASTPVQCECRICNHRWRVVPYSLKSGSGCPECADSGFKNSKESCVYLLVDDTELPTCIKVGVTNDFDRRLKEIVSRTPFPVHVLKVFPFEAGCATSQLEQFAHTVFADRNCHFEGFDGCTEWFWYSHEIVDFLENYC